MKKFLVLYKSSATAQQQITGASPEQMQAGMDAWRTWASAAQPYLVDLGAPLGDPVRIIRDPLFGKIGEVSALPHDLRQIPTESEVRVLEVTFSDGSKTVIPRTNIEVIEGT